MRRASEYLPNAILALLLAAFVGVPLVVAVWSGRQGTESKVEKRELAALPAFPENFDAWLKFPKAFDAWATDRFGFRDDLLAGYKWLLASVFHQSASDHAFIGKDDWLYVNEDGTLKDMLGESAYPAGQVNKIVRQVNVRGNLLTAAHKYFVFLVAPDKHTVYPQYLPRGVYAGFSARRLGALDDAMRESGNDYYVDISRQLIQDTAHTPFRLYYMSDTHWNPWGGYLGFRAFMHDWKNNPIQHPVQYTFDEFRIPGRINHGDLAVMSGFQPHDVDIWPPGDVDCWQMQPWHPPAALSKRLNLPQSHVSTIDCKAGKGVALVIHDSFMSNLRFYLPQHFAHTYFIWKYVDARTLAALIEQTHPDVVITERVERLMRHFPPTDDAALLAAVGLAGQPATLAANGELEIGSGDGAVARTPEPVTVAIDKVSRQGDLVRVQGWAMNADGRPPAAIIAVSQGKVVGEAPVADYRPDVARVRHDAKLAWSGYSMDIPRSVIADDPTGLHLYSLGFDHYGEIRVSDKTGQTLRRAAADSGR